MRNERHILFGQIVLALGWFLLGVFWLTQAASGGPETRKNLLVGIGFVLLAAAFLWIVRWQAKKRSCYAE